MATKERILEAALQQFNELGTDAVTVRSIAQEVGISHGNLCYHFPNTDAIIYQLYLNTVEEMDAQVEELLQAESGLELMFRQGESNFKILYKYKFLLLDFVRITRRIPAIREHFRELMRFRRQQITATLGEMVQKGWLIPEPEPAFYDKLTYRVLMFGDWWIPHAEIHFDGNTEDMLRFYYDVLISEIVPLLTETGRAFYEKVHRQVLTLEKEG